MFSDDNDDDDSDRYQSAGGIVIFLEKGLSISTYAMLYSTVNLYDTFIIVSCVFFTNSNKTNSELYLINN